MRLLTDDVLGASREGEDLSVYLDAFDSIEASGSNEVVVLVDEGGEILGTAQLTLIPGLARRGRTRLGVEAVRVARGSRGAGLGRFLFSWIEEYARENGASLIQMTSDLRRERAHDFYRSLGYEPSHVGFKKAI